MTWDEIYRLALVCMGENPENPLFFEGAVASIRLTCTQLRPLYCDVCQSTNKEVQAFTPVTSLQEICPFPAEFDSILVYGLVSSLLQNEDSEKAAQYADLCRDACLRLRRSLPAHLHEITDCYQS